MTTIDQLPETDLYLGDCILHLTHHEMEQECWNAVIQFYSDHFQHPWVTKAAAEPEAMRNEGLVRLYKFEYEQRVLDKFMRTGKL